MSRSFIATICLLLPACVSMGADLRAVCGDPPRSHAEHVIGGRHGYSIQMGGTLDGEMTRDPVGYWAFDQFWEPNVTVKLENIGDTPVVNPWIRREDMPDTRTLKSIVDHVVTPEMSESEKARRLWEFEIKNRFHATTNDDEVDDTIKRFNVYGYTLCGNESKIMSDLWRAAGLRVRKGYPNGHSTAEVFYDGAWHLLDSDESIICLKRDNKTIASEAEIVADHDLMKRTHTYGPLHDDDRMRDETSAALHYWEGERRGEQPSLTRHRMDFTLRPNEAITWSWSARNRFHGQPFEGTMSSSWNRRWRIIAHVMNGELSYAPDLTREATLKYVRAEGVQRRDSGPFQGGLYLTGKSGSIIVPVKSAYPVVGGRVEVDFARLDLRSEQLTISLSFDNGSTWKDVWTTTASEYARTYVDLDDYFQPTDAARYEYLLRVKLESGATEPVVVVKGLYLTSTLQMARLALPGVKLGNNRFLYSDESPEGRKVRITHSWRECSPPGIPGAPAGAIAPVDRGEADGTKVAFRWQPPPGGASVDYEFQLGEYPDMRWVLSPNFHKLIARTAGRGTESFELPYHGLLNPGETYYWRVRARSPEGIWGPWSRTFSFSASAPAVPLKPAAEYDTQRRTATLHWEPGQGGTVPAKYRIYGSNERGFTAYDRPFRYHAGLDGIKDSPPNLLLETQSAVKSIELPPQLWRAYYRVVAVDSSGRESGPSEKAELARPLIRTRTLPDARRGVYYEAPVEVAASIGHLVSQNEDGRPYQMRYRSGDDLVFELAGAPETVTINEKTGLIAGHVPAGAPERYELTIRVKSRNTGASDTIKLLLPVR